METPLAKRNVFAIPPPTIILSTSFTMFLNKSNLVEILAPPIIAVSGLLGLSKELDKAFNSRSIRGPAKLGMSLAIPVVDAWARWETEKASLTKQSPKSARLFENSGSFFSSPG